MSFNSMSFVIVWSDFGAPENKICHCFCFSPSIFHAVMGLDAMILGVCVCLFVFFCNLFFNWKKIAL